MRKLIRFVIGLGLIVVIIAAVGSQGGTSHTAAPAPTPTPSAGLMLATLDKGGYVAPNDPAVAHMTAALMTLDGRCTEPARTIPDLVTIIKQQLAQRGVRETYAQLLTHLTASIPKGMRTKCVDVFAAYVVLRTH